MRNMLEHPIRPNTPGIRLINFQKNICVAILKNVMGKELAPTGVGVKDSQDHLKMSNTSTMKASLGTDARIHQLTLIT